MAQIPQIDTELLLKAFSRPSLGQTLQAGTQGFGTGVDIGMSLAEQKARRKKEADDLMSQIEQIKIARDTESRLKQQSEAGFITPEELKTKTPMGDKMTTEKARLFLPEKPQKEPRPFALSPKGRLRTGQIVSFDPNKGFDVVGGTDPYNQNIHGEMQPLVSPELDSAALKDITNIRDSISKLEEVESLFTKDSTGPVEARLTDFSALTGINIPLLRNLSSITDDKIKFRTATQSAINDYIKAITGAQMSEPEARRIMKALPDRKAADEAFIPALQEILSLSRKKLRNNLETYKAAGFRNIDQIAGLDKQPEFASKIPQTTEQSSRPEVGQMFQGQKVKSVKLKRK
jgi:hypothetical protein